MWIIYTTRMLNELGNDIIALDLMIHQVNRVQKQFIS